LGWVFNIVTSGVIIGAFLTNKVIGRTAQLSSAEELQVVSAVLLLALASIISGVIGQRVKDLVGSLKAE
jgi:hypothetical protein